MSKIICHKNFISNVGFYLYFLFIYYGFTFVEKSCVDAPVITNSLIQESRVYWLPNQVVQYQCQSEWTFEDQEYTSVSCQQTQDGISAEWSSYANIKCIPGKHRTCII